MTKEDRDFMGNPKPKEGYWREYIDHTGVFYRDWPIGSWPGYHKDEILQEEIDKIVIQEIVDAYYKK